jgi:hypothetical protein
MGSASSTSRNVDDTAHEPGAVVALASLDDPRWPQETRVTCRPAPSNLLDRVLCLLRLGREQRCCSDGSRVGSRTP